MPFGGRPPQQILRDPIPESVATAYRRFNIFKVAALVLGFTALGIAALAALRGEQAFRDVPRLTLVEIALLALAYPLHWAGQRIDSVHRRKL
jgi:hypothetical protein